MSLLARGFAGTPSLDSLTSSEPQRPPPPRSTAQGRRPAQRRGLTLSELLDELHQQAREPVTAERGLALRHLLGRLRVGSVRGGLVALLDPRVSLLHSQLEPRADPRRRIQVVELRGRERA